MHDCIIAVRIKTTINLSNMFLLFDLILILFVIVIVNIGVEINLSNKTFKEELKNKSSPAYKKLEQDVHDEVAYLIN